MIDNDTVVHRIEEKHYIAKTFEKSRFEADPLYKPPTSYPIKDGRVDTRNQAQKMFDSKYNTSVVGKLTPKEKKQWRMTEEDAKLLEKIRHVAVKAHEESQSILPFKVFAEATFDNRLVIDKSITLNAPIDSPNLYPKERRELYLQQEELMHDLAKIEREEVKEDEKLSAGLIYQSDTALIKATEALRNISPETLKRCRKEEQAFVDKVFPKLPK
jgi:hypothetical protein